MPVFEVAPLLKPNGCTVNKQDRDCIVMLKSDFDELFYRAKAMCHALGGTDTNCQWP